MCAIVVVALEVFGFNHYFWSTLGNTPITDAKVVTSQGDLTPGMVFDGGPGVVLDIYPGGDEGTYVDVDSLEISARAVERSADDVSTFTDIDPGNYCGISESLVVYDEGHALGYDTDWDGLGEQLRENPDTPPTQLDGGDKTANFHKMCLTVPSSMRRALHPSGKVSRITLVLYRNALRRDFALDSVTLNTRVPLRFNALRVLLLTALAVSVACFFTRKEATIGDCVAAARREAGEGAAGAPPMTERQRRQWLALMLALMAAAAAIQFQATDYEPMYQYSDLARSLLAGRLDIPDDTRIQVTSALSNPYDYGLRAESKTFTGYDVAYYEGRFYIYFGIVPALLFYLPVQVLTGAELEDHVMMAVIDLLLVLGAFLIADELRRALGARVPWNLHLLLACTLAVAPALCIEVKFSSIYYVSLGCGVAFAQLGLWLWLASVRDPKAGGGTGICLWRGMLGSLLMALSVGCRPTMALASFLAFAVYHRQFARIREKGMWWRILLLVAPYVPVAAGIMWYNAARFGSPFEFGARYQLTIRDVTHPSTDPILLFYGLWYYLLKPPAFRLTFPYMLYQTPTFDYAGDMYFAENAGGVFTLIPLLLLLLAPSVWRRCRRTAPLRWGALGVMLALVAVDSLEGGFCVRYSMDFRFVLVIAALASAMEWFGQAARDGQAAAMRCYRGLGALCMATLLLSALTTLCAFIDIIFWSDPRGNTAFWFRLWDFLDLLKP